MHISSLAYKLLILAILGFPDSEHLGATRGAHSLGGRPAILHGYALGILHLFLGSAFNTIGLHWVYLLFYER
jgi:hypothetical protein